jgi:hypothetical protein
MSSKQRLCGKQIVEAALRYDGLQQRRDQLA